MTKAEQIVRELQQYQQGVVLSGRVHRMSVQEFDGEQVKIVDKILGVEYSGTQSVSTHRASMKITAESMIFLMETALGNWEKRGGAAIDAHNEQHRAKIEAHLIEFAAEIRAEVHREIASGAGAADELLRKATT